MTCFSLKVEKEDYVGNVDCEPSKEFDNIFIDHNENKIYIMDHSLNITYAITVPNN